MIVQVNQIGSVTESIEAVKMSKHAGWGVMASHRRYDMSTMFQPSLPFPSPPPPLPFFLEHTHKLLIKKHTHTHTNKNLGFSICVADVVSLFNVVVKPRIPLLQTFQLDWQQ